MQVLTGLSTASLATSPPGFTNGFHPWLPFKLSKPLSPESRISWVPWSRGFCGTSCLLTALVGLERAASQDEKAAGLLGPTRHWLIYSLKSSEFMPRTEFNSGAGNALACFGSLRLGFLRGWEMCSFWNGGKERVSAYQSTTHFAGKR